MSDLICQKCGSKNPTWYADNDLFNQVNGSPDGVLCPMCFQELADSKGRNIIFKVEDMAKDDQSEIQRLTKEVEELKVSKWVNAKIKPLGEVILMTSSRVQIIGDWYEGGWRTHRSKWENGVYKSAFNEGDIVAWHPLPEESMWRPTTLIGNQSEEIQRLTKEVEELKEKMTAEHCPSLPECYKASQELTRLRELLSRMAMTLEIYNTGEDAKIVTLLSEYNALNHKP